MKNTLLIIVIICILALSGLGIWYILQPTSLTSSTQKTSPVITKSQEQPTAQSPTSARPSKAYTLAEISNHNTESDCWVAIDNNVYDVTAFIPAHPGGKEILEGCGKDATQLFNGEREHAENNASAQLPLYIIGSVSQ